MMMMTMGSFPFSFFSAQDFMALVPWYSKRPPEEETINDPTNSRHYWRFRKRILSLRVPASFWANSTNTHTHLWSLLLQALTSTSRRFSKTRNGFKKSIHWWTTRIASHTAGSMLDERKRQREGGG